MLTASAIKLRVRSRRVQGCVSALVHLVVTKKSNKDMLQVAVFVWWDLRGSLSFVEWNLVRGSVPAQSCTLLLSDVPTCTVGELVMSPAALQCDQP